MLYTRKGNWNFTKQTNYNYSVRCRFYCGGELFVQV